MATQPPRQQGSIGPVKQQHQPTKPKASSTKERPLVATPTPTTTATTTTKPLERISKLRASQTSIGRPNNDTSLTSLSHNLPPALEIFSKYQPNKVFLNKCRTELKTLLSSIKDSYHNDIKLLYTDEQFTDLFIRVENDPLAFNKPLHKCLIISRAFKLYSALKSFKIVNDKTDQDIIISEFQAKLSIPQRDNENKDDNDDRDESDDEQLRIRKEKLREALEIFHCELPKDLINPELLLSFVRRAYLDQELIDEEAQLVRTIVAWLKLNRPDLIKTTAAVRSSPDHRESFRTVQPDFDQVSSHSSTTMSQGRRDPNESLIDLGLTDQPRNLLSNHGSDLEQEVDEPTSQQASIREESSTGSLLTRTETFELISKSQMDSPTASDAQLSNKNTPASSINDDDGRRRSETGGDANESESSEPYVPTTRTGLKPKKFTTPVGVGRLHRTSKTSEAASKSSPDSSKQDENQRLIKTEPKRQLSMSKTGTGASSVSRSHSLNKQNTASDAKETRLDKKPNVQSKISSTSGLPARGKVTASPGAKTATAAASKPTVIARAHPISIERSQSPGTTLASKSSGSKNFIAANKRLVAQMDKKLAQDHQSDEPQASNVDSEDGGETSLMPLEPLTTDNLPAQLDKYTLAAQSKLAEALSRMFIDEISIDCSVLVRDDRHIGAHRCILAARSPYFSDVIAQNCQQPPAQATSTESTVSHQLQPLKIDLSEFSHSAVYFSILHIYSGIAKVPDDLDLEELTKLSHLLHVNTLRQVCMHNILMIYCHFFHKPCNVCSLGVLKALPLAWRYDYTELYSKCLNWIGAHFASIFCLEEFSKLKPHDLIEECYNATLSQLTPDNVIHKTVECQKLLKNLPRVKWTESIICLVGRQLEDFCHYVADNYEKILQSESFLALGKSCWECEILEENLLAAMNHLKPDSGCKTLIQLDKIECSIESYFEEPKNVSETFASLISKMRKYCERYLLKEATSVVHCSSWRQMNPALQKRIKDQALLATDFDEPTRQLAAKPKLPSMARHQPRSSPSPQSLLSGNHSENETTRSPSNRSTPDSRLKSPSTTYLPPPKNKQAATRQVKVLK